MQKIINKTTTKKVILELKNEPGRTQQAINKHITNPLRVTESKK